MYSHVQVHKHVHTFVHTYIHMYTHRAIIFYRNLLISTHLGGKSSSNLKGIERLMELNFLTKKFIDFTLLELGQNLAK
jgi:hypothetical protein